eukprot:3321127-Prymnesium_polylepis.1
MRTREHGRGSYENNLQNSALGQVGAEKALERVARPARVRFRNNHHARKTVRAPFGLPPREARTVFRASK